MHVIPENDGKSIQEVKFNIPNFWERKSTFYLEKKGKMQAKKAEIKIICRYDNGKVETLSEVTLNLSTYLGKG